MTMIRKLAKPFGLELLAQLQQGGSSPTPQTLNKIISSCATSTSLDLGIRLHAVVIKLGFCSNVYICSALVDMYGKCGSLANAQKQFDEMSDRNVVTWNSLISGYLQAELPKRAVGLFLEMLKVGVVPTPFSLSGALVGCSQLEAEELGAQVHGLSLKTGLCYNVVVGTGLIDMYSKCCSVNDSMRVFNQMPERNVITWTSMVTGYAQNGQSDEAMILAREMLRLGLKPNYVTYNSLLSSFSSPDFWVHCRQIHCRIMKEGFEFNVYIVVTLLTIYSDCSNSLEDFQKLCSCVAIWDQISWNAVIAGFSNIGSCEEALKCFSDMRQACVAMNFFTFASILRAVGTLSDLEAGKKIHALVFKSGQASNFCVQNGLVSMYARCGAIHDSKWVFTLMNEHDVVSWNSLLAGYAQHGFGLETVELFEQMRRAGVKPDNTTFLIVLTACSHVGLVHEGLMYFDLMRNDDLLEPPRMEHYATVVDLFGRAGNLHEAEAFVDSMPIEPGPSVYKALLSACKVHGNKEIALLSAKKLQELCPNDPATYILLSNVLVTGGCWDDAAGVRKLMYDRGIRKTPGHSWI
ncbi:pentatricopeptide repeat-containing protein At3g09040, mitochondrial-like [Prunus avium]|uniref:Pentatricopeptide repeat-containing protein At3g09040, mitochondrial-like n=1 Tax=Prunus avium TaxID=42229 RepID=A0A6P5SEG4_PRUAV|nr:pentatricopeptide repeat-containing protein At3g09040, mitochondrial-like [Prunus avium]